MDRSRPKIELLFGVVFCLAAVRFPVIQTISGSSFFSSLLDNRFWLVLLIALVFLLGRYFGLLRKVQPYLMIVCAFIPLLEYSDGIYGFGFYFVGVVLLYMDGFFHRYRTLKIVSIVSLLIGFVAASTIITNKTLYGIIGLVFFALPFGLFLFFVFQERLIVFIKEEKPILRLSEKGLYPKEILYTLTLLEGKSLKETAFSQGVKESTVRNAMSRTYKKLGVHDKAELLQLSEKYRIID